MFGLRPSDIEMILAVFKHYPDIEQAMVFGSRAMGNHKPGSDVDIALKGDLKSSTSVDVTVELNERLPLPYRFDVVAYNALPKGPLTEHIDQYGKVLYKR